MGVLFQRVIVRQSRGRTTAGLYAQLDAMMAKCLVALAFIGLVQCFPIDYSVERAPSCSAAPSDGVNWGGLVDSLIPGDAGAATDYQMLPDENLHDVAVKFGVPWHQIYYMNVDRVNADINARGATLRIGRPYTVQKYDTVDDVASRYGTTPWSVCGANSLNEEGDIEAEQVIVLVQNLHSVICNPQQAWDTRKGEKIPISATARIINTKPNRFRPGDEWSDTGHPSPGQPDGGEMLPPFQQDFGGKDQLWPYKVDPEWWEENN